MDDIGIFRLPNKYSHSLNITGFKQKETLNFSVSLFDGDIKTVCIKTDNWQELKDFLQKNQFQRYEAYIINPKYFNLMERLRTELYGEKSKKINSQRRILILLKRLINKEALDLNELATEFNVSHSQLVRDIAIIRSEFDYVEIRYNRIDHKYELK